MQATEKAGVTGKYRTLFLTRDLLPDEIEQARRYVRGDDSARHGLPIEREQTADNISPVSGRGVLARLLCADTTYSGAINYGAFGSGSAAFSSSSTQLNTEVYRKLCSGAAADTNVAYVDWFISTGDVANQTFNEFAAVIDGTASANTGQAISLLLTGGWVKSGAMFVSLSVSINA